MLLFSHFMLPSWSGLLNVRTGKHTQCFLATRVVLYWIKYFIKYGIKSIVCVTGTMGWRTYIGGVKYFATVLQIFPLFHGIKMLCIFHWHGSAEVLLLPWHAFVSQTSQRFCTIQMNMGLEPRRGVFSQWELFPAITQTTILGTRSIFLDEDVYTSWNYCKNFLPQDSCV